MSRLTVAAVDLGAESGRVAAVEFDGERLHLRVHHRFQNGAAQSAGRLRWDVDGLWKEISSGLASLAGQVDVAAVGVDTWGLDYGNYAGDGQLLEQPVAYRDRNRIEAFAWALEKIGSAALYEHTGIQLMEVNSLFGLIADAHSRPEILAKTRRLLMMPDVFHNLLSGSTVTEYTIASTTGMFDVRSKSWATGLLERVGIPTHFLPEVVASGTDVGPVVGELAEVGLSRARVILPAAHDTASAILAIPDAGPETLFISSGTWSLVGVVVEEPVVNEASRRANLTNEGGYGTTVRLLRNVMGLWVLQECRRQWMREALDIDYQSLVQLALAEPPLRSLIDPNVTEFLAPGDMPARIRAHCRRMGFPVPKSVGQVARTVIDSLALSYRLAMEDIVEVTGVPITTIAVVGGGSNNELLQQCTANATGCPVVCGAVEATALGNAAAQLVALGEFDGVEQVWTAVRASVERRIFQPQESARWDDVAARFRGMTTIERRKHGFEDSAGPVRGPGSDVRASELCTQSGRQ